MLRHELMQHCPRWESCSDDRLARRRYMTHEQLLDAARGDGEVEAA